MRKPLTVFEAAAFLSGIEDANPILASVLIAKLQALIDERGDHPVEDYSHDYETSVVGVEFMDVDGLHKPHFQMVVD